MLYKYKFNRKSTPKIRICNFEIEHIAFFLIKCAGKNNHNLISLLQHIQLFTGFNIFGNNLNYFRYGTHKNT